MHDEDTQRPRRIVRLAAKMAKNRELKTWLSWDEYGSWEKQAKEMLAKVPDLMAAKNLSLTEAQVDNEIATMIYGFGLQAIYNDALKHPKKRGRR